MSAAGPPPATNAPARVRWRLQLDDGRTTFALGSVLVIAFCLARALLDAYRAEPLWPLAFVLDVVRDLGIAFIVGGVVSLGIERISRGRFLHEIDREIHRIERNVINAAYLRLYPDGYTDAVIGMLEQTRYFKFDLNVVIDLSEPLASDGVDGSELLLHEQTTSYRARNITRKPQRIRPRMFLDLDWDRFKPILLEWRVGDTHLGEDELRNLVGSDSAADDYSWYTFPKPVLLAPGEDVFILSRVRTTKHRRDTTTWCGIQPADSLRFTVNHPIGFDAYAQPKTASRSSDSPVVSDGRRVVVNIFTPLLPYMIVEYGWRPRADEDPAAGGTGLRNRLSSPT